MNNFFKTALVLIFLLSVSCVFAQDREQKFNEMLNVKELFYAEPLVFYPYDSAAGRLDLYIELPLENLQFKRNNASEDFEASIEYNVTIKNSNGEPVISQTYTQTLSTTKTEQKNITEKSASSLKNYYLAPGNYKLTFAFRDRNSNKEKSKEYDIKVRNPLTDNLIFSDILLLSEYTDSPETGKEIVPLITSNVGMLGSFYLFYEIRYRGSDTITKNLKLNFYDDKGAAVFDTTVRCAIKPGSSNVVTKITNDKYYIGNYRVDITDGTEILAHKLFYYRWSDMPVNIRDLDKAIDQLMYIAESDDISFINKGKTKEERLRRFLKFWKDKDPTPNTPKNELMNVYYSRVNTATERYTHFVEGWKTDMGMVYIILGNPSNIDRHPFESDSKPYEIWTYYDINRQFIFVDDTGFGDYRLITPMYDDRTRIRY